MQNQKTTRENPTRENKENSGIKRKPNEIIIKNTFFSIPSWAKCAAMPPKGKKADCMFLYPNQKNSRWLISFKINFRRFAGDRWLHGARERGAAAEMPRSGGWGFKGSKGEGFFSPLVLIMVYNIISSFDPSWVICCCFHLVFFMVFCIGISSCSNFLGDFSSLWPGETPNSKLTKPGLFEWEVALGWSQPDGRWLRPLTMPLCCHSCHDPRRSFFRSGSTRTRPAKANSHEFFFGSLLFPTKKQETKAMADCPADFFRKWQWVKNTG